MSAPLALPRHHRDITLRAQRSPSPRRSPRARRPAAPTSPWLTAPSWRVDAAHLVAISAPARATCRVSAPLARPRRPRDLTLRALCCSSTPRRPRARRPAAPTTPLPPAPSWPVGAARLVASSAPARAARRLSAPLALPRHRRDITLRARALLDAYPCATVQARVDRPRRRLVAARAVVARLQVSLRLAPRSERARCLRASATTVTSPPSRALCAVHHRATPQACVDRPRRRRLRRPRRRSALTISPFSRARRRLTPRAERARRLRASANPVAPFRCSTSPRRPSPRPSPQACQPSAPTPPFPSAPSHRVVARRLCPLSFNRGAGSRRAPREPVVLAPSPQHHPVARPHFDAHLLEPCLRPCRPTTPNSSSPRPPPTHVDWSRPIGTSVSAHAVHRASAFSSASAAIMPSLCRSSADPRASAAVDPAASARAVAAARQLSHPSAHSGGPRRAPRRAKSPRSPVLSTAPTLSSATATITPRHPSSRRNQTRVDLRCRPCCRPHMPLP